MNVAMRYRPYRKSVIHGRNEPGAAKAPEAVLAVGNTAHMSNGRCQPLKRLKERIMINSEHGERCYFGQD